MVVPDAVGSLPVSHPYSNLVLLPDEVATFRTTTLSLECTFQIFLFGGEGGGAGSEDFACATLPTTPLDFQGKV